MEATLQSEKDGAIASRHFGAYATKDEWGEMGAIYVSHYHGGYPAYRNEDEPLPQIPSNIEWDEIHYRVSGTQWLSIYP